MTGAPARVADYAPKDDTIAGLIEYRNVVRACNDDSDAAAHLVARLHAMRSQILRTAEDLFRISMVAQTRAQEALELHDVNAEGAIREVTAAAEEAHAVVIKIRSEIRLSGTDPDAHPTDELVRATLALSSAKQHTINVERDLNTHRAELEAVWVAAARQCVQDGVMLFGALPKDFGEVDRGDTGLDEPFPKNIGGDFSMYPLPVYQMRDVLHREKPRESYAAGAAS